MDNAARAALWDMDGVLIVSADDHYHSWVEVLQDYGVTMARAQFEQTFGMNNQNLLRRLYDGQLTAAQIDEIAARKEARYREMIRGRVQAEPGVREWLERLQRAGWRQAIASSAPMANIAAILTELDLWPAFDLVLSGARLARSKPDPDIFLQAAAGLGVPPDRCVVIEDSTVGIEAARRAGMASIGVTTTHSPEGLRGADRVVARLDELPPDAFELLTAAS